MNKKLEDYRDYLADTVGSKLTDGRKALDVGFDAAIALRLPIKFAIWKQEKCDKGGIHGYQLQRDLTEKLGHKPDIVELYNYWLEEVFKIK